MKKRIVATIVVIATIFCLTVFCQAESQKEISIYVNGNKLSTDVPPQIIDGSTLVPLRVIFEALGATVEWNQETKTVYSTLGDTSIRLTIGEKNLYKGDHAYAISLSVPAQIIDGRTMVPVRAISESFGFHVDWYKEIRTISIKDNKRVKIIPYYNQDGEKVSIEEALSQEYDLIGWAEDINKIQGNIIMYSADGRTISILKSQIDDYKAVGWYEEPVVLMYAADGRTMYVEQSRVEAHKQVGWSTEPFVLMYAADGRTMYVEQSKVEANKLVGWTTEIPKIYPTSVSTTQYLELSVGATHMLTCSFMPSSTTETFIDWSSSNPSVAQVGVVGMIHAISEGSATITAKTSNGLTATCHVVVKDFKYDSSKVGSLTGVITWQYNKFVGTKADVGADLMLIPAIHTPTENDDYTTLIFSSTKDDSIYVTEVDGSGNYYFDNIPAGKYILVIKGKNTNDSPAEQSINSSRVRKYLTGVISEKAISNFELQLKIYSFDVAEIVIRENQTTRYSKDWGYTYI